MLAPYYNGGVKSIITESINKNFANFGTRLEAVILPRMEAAFHGEDQRRDKD
jgi:hypothetical protein